MQYPCVVYLVILYLAPKLPETGHQLASYHLLNSTEFTSSGCLGQVTVFQWQCQCQCVQTSCTSSRECRPVLHSSCITVQNITTSFKEGVNFHSAKTVAV